MAFSCTAINAYLKNTHDEACIVHEPVGYLDMLKSSENTRGFEQIPYDQGDGHRRDVVIRFIPEIDPDSNLDAAPDLCTDGVEQPPTSITVSLTDEIWTQPIDIEVDEYSKLCSDWNYTMDLMSKLLNSANQTLDKKLLLIQNSNWGDFYNSTNTAVSVDILQADGSPNYPGMIEALEQYKLINCMRKPMVVGQGNVSRMFSGMNVGCCNTTQGIDLAMAKNDLIYFYEKQANANWGTNEFGLFQPGAVQLVTYNTFRGKFAYDQPTSHRGVIVDTTTGLTWDFAMKFNDCKVRGKWTISLGLTYGLVFIPGTTLWAVGSPMNGVNGTLNFVGTQI